MAQNFEVDTSDYMGFKYEEYLNELMSIAMSKPSEYYKIRTKTYYHPEPGKSRPKSIDLHENMAVRTIPPGGGQPRHK